jgi:hypothetical protein
MYIRVAAGLMVVLGGMLPAWSGELSPDEARRFVVGKLFAFNCFEGTRGAGRIQSDGSVAGSIQLRGAGPVRHVTLPPNTIRISSEAVCASVPGVAMQPCFSVDKRDQQSFRGSVAGLGFAYCDFTRRGGRVALATSGTRAESARNNAEPLHLRPTMMATARGE